MKKLSKKYLVLSLVMVFMASLLVGCGGGGDKEKAAEGDKGKVIKMRLAQSKADNHPVSQGYVKFAELVKEKTNGQIEIQVFNNAVLGSDRECIEGAQRELWN